MEENIVYFKPKARIMELLGEQLIKSHVLALFELVKNSYDADATKVDIMLMDVDNPSGEIEVKDNGVGMDINIVKTIWMEPAHSHKSKARLNAQRTDKGRLPVGEKGVGRFAVHRLGKKVEMVTKTLEANEVVVEIDWEKFNEYDYLEDAPVIVYERDPEVFNNQEQGTRIVISGLKQTWARGQVRDLYRSVTGMTAQRLMLKNEKKEGSLSLTEKTHDEFIVSMEVYPDKGWLDDMFDPVTARDQAMYIFDFILNDNGFSYDYEFKPLPALAADYKGIVEGRKVSQHRESFEFFAYSIPTERDPWRKRPKRITRPCLGVKPKEDKTEKKYLGIGPLRGRILGFDFDRKLLSRYLKDEKEDLTRYLNKQGGIRVYRDYLRVYDYGEPGNDWLGLDHRRIQDPAIRLSNKLMLGEVHLDLEQSDGLQEKTNREGFIESDSFRELQYAMLCILSNFETERNKDKQTLRDAFELPPSPVKRNLKRKRTTEELLDELYETVLEKKLQNQIGGLVKEVRSAYIAARDTLLSTAGAGMGLITVFHELERGIRALNAAIQSGIPTEKLKKQSTELIGLLKGATYMISSSSMETIKASRLVGIALGTQELRFKRHNVTCINGCLNLPKLDFQFKGIRRMLTAALVNLIDNSIYWTDQEEKESVIWVGPSSGFEGSAIVVADNGSGFIDSPEDVVRPFFSRKAEGMGIGLYYADWVLRSHNGRLAFPDPEKLDLPQAIDGAVVAMVFNEAEKI
jgi:hypothetical protein